MLTAGSAFFAVPPSPLRDNDFCFVDRDVLYLPPYWFHQVSTLLPGVGVNIWSESALMALEERLKGVPIPLSTTWPLDQRLLVLSIALPRLAAAALPFLSSQEAAASYLRAMIRLQYSPLYSKTTMESEVSKGTLSFCKSFLQTDRERAASTWRRQLEDAEKFMTSSFSIVQPENTERSQDDRAVLELELFAFLEKLSSIVLPTDALHPFFANCL